MKRTYRINMATELGWPPVAVDLGDILLHDGKSTLTTPRGESTTMTMKGIEAYLGYGYLTPTRATAEELAKLEGCMEEEIYELPRPDAPKAPQVKAPTQEVEVVDDVVEEEVWEAEGDLAGTEDDVNMEIPAGCGIDIAPNPANLKEPKPVKAAKPKAKPAPQPVEAEEEEGPSEVISMEVEDMPKGIKVGGGDGLSGGDEEIISFEPETTEPTAPSKPASKRQITKQPRPTR